MSVRYSRISIVTALLLGVVAGWSMSLLRPTPLLHAGAGDRNGETILTTGPLMVRIDDSTKAPTSLDAVYFLDYKGGRLLASLPTFRQSINSTKIIDSLVERNLAADFKLDLDTGPRPHFLMTTGSLGPYTAGWAPLYVVETTTQQLAVYRLHIQQSSVKSSRPKFELLQILPYASTPEGAPSGQ